jgi:hypothetical protein
MATQPSASSSQAITAKVRPTKHILHGIFSGAIDSGLNPRQSALSVFHAFDQYRRVWIQHFTDQPELWPWPHNPPPPQARQLQQSHKIDYHHGRRTWRPSVTSPPDVSGSAAHPRCWVRINQIAGTTAAEFADFCEWVCSDIEAHPLPNNGDVHRYFYGTILPPISTNCLPDNRRTQPWLQLRVCTTPTLSA